MSTAEPCVETLPLIEPPLEQLTGRERREAERVISYWQRKIAQLHKPPTVSAIDWSYLSSKDWSHRFVIAIDPVVEDSSLLFYGEEFARLLELPKKSVPFVPMARQLPGRFTEVFLRGCEEAHNQRAMVRVEGEVERNDGVREMYRAAFIPVGVKENSLTHLAFGAFNSRSEMELAA